MKEYNQSRLLLMCFWKAKANPFASEFPCFLLTPILSLLNPKWFPVCPALEVLLRWASGLIYVCVPCRWVVSWKCIIRLKHAAVSTPTPAHSIAEKMWNLKKHYVFGWKERNGMRFIHSLTHWLTNQSFYVPLCMQHYTRLPKDGLLQPLPSGSLQCCREAGVEKIWKYNELMAFVGAL